MTGKVLVTGASGYIAGFVVRQLLEQGWTVHATVRNLSREAELRPRLGSLLAQMMGLPTPVYIAPKVEPIVVPPVPANL